MKTKKIPAQALKFTSAVAIGGGESSIAAGEPRPFSGVAYSGGEIVDHGYWDKVVFDLSTTTAQQVTPVLFAHDDRLPVGRTDSVAIGADIQVAGVIYDDADGAKILGKPGHPWEMSVYIKPSRIEEVLDGASTIVNGNLFTGPGYIFRDNTIREVSFVSLGADPNTSASLFAAGDSDLEIETSTIGAPTMTPEEIQALQARVAELEAQNTQFSATIAAAEAAAAEAAATAAEAARQTRFAAVKDLLGEVDEATAEPYMTMSDLQFSAVVKTVGAVKKSVPAHLFSEQATQAAAGAPATKSALMLDAERRAAAAKK
jgi:hypothetical protein